MPELEKTKEKLPHFPQEMLTLFKDNDFMKTAGKAEFDINKYLRNENLKIYGVKLP